MGVLLLTSFGVRYRALATTATRLLQPAGWPRSGANSSEFT